MSDVVRQALDLNAIRSSTARKALLLRGLSVIDTLEDLPESLDPAALSDAVAPIRAKPLDEMLENATPFFWLNLERFYDALECPNALPLATEHLLRSALDSPPMEQCFKVPGTRAFVLPVNDAWLFESQYADQILTECDSSFPDTLATAIKLVAAVDQETGQRIVDNILWFVPISSPNTSTHCSFTSPRLHGVMFLSQTDEVLRLAEAIVHEFGHTELHVLMSVEPLTGDVSPDELFYSPWRPDPRPIAGLLHGLYVFSEVLSFLTNVAQQNVTDSETARQRVPLIAHRLRLGLAQMPRKRLSSLTNDILSEIESNIETQTRRLEIILNGVPQPLREHLQQWLYAHPELASHVAAL